MKRVVETIFRQKTVLSRSLVLAAFSQTASAILISRLWPSSRRTPSWLGHHAVVLLCLSHDGLRKQVSHNAQEHHQQREERLVFVHVGPSWMPDNHEINGQDREGLANVFEHRIQDGQQVHSAPSLYRERAKHHD